MIQIVHPSVSATFELLASCTTFEQALDKMKFMNNNEKGGIFEVISMASVILDGRFTSNRRHNLTSDPDDHGIDFQLDGIGYQSKYRSRGSVTLELVGNVISASANQRLRASIITNLPKISRHVRRLVDSGTITICQLNSYSEHDFYLIKSIVGYSDELMKDVRPQESRYDSAALISDTSMLHIYSDIQARKGVIALGDEDKFILYNPNDTALIYLHGKTINAAAMVVRRTNSGYAVCASEANGNHHYFHIANDGLSVSHPHVFENAEAGACVDDITTAKPSFVLSRDLGGLFLKYHLSDKVFATNHKRLIPLVPVTT